VLPALNKDGTFTRPTDFDTKSGSLVLEAERANALIDGSGSRQTSANAGQARMSGDFRYH
jgi:hypothetical protein